MDWSSYTNAVSFFFSCLFQLKFKLILKSSNVLKILIRHSHLFTSEAHFHWWSYIMVFLQCYRTLYLRTCVPALISPSPGCTRSMLMGGVTTPQCPVISWRWLATMNVWPGYSTACWSDQTIKKGQCPARSIVYSHQFCCGMCNNSFRCSCTIVQSSWHCDNLGEWS